MKKTYLTFILLLIIVITNAQSGIVTTGGDSFSVGQISYSANDVIEGIQIPYEIYTITGIDLINTIDCKVYPNPASDFITLNVEKYKDLSYIFYDMSGKILEQKKLTSKQHNISMKYLKPSIYFLLINNEILFKIVKQ